MKEETLELLKDVADEVDGDIIEDYSGRFMYGKTCPAITCESFIPCIEEAAKRGITGASYDQMGRKYVVYWRELE